MPEVPYREDLPAVISDIERRLRSLETSPRLLNSSFPWPSATIDSTFGTSSTTAVDSTPVAGPSLTVTIGKEGRCLVTASVYIGLDNSSQTGSVDLFIDGAYTWNILALSNASSPIAGNVTSQRNITGLSPGDHTFVLKYRSTNGNSNFSGRTIVVQPY